MKRRVRLLRDGRHQAIRISPAFELPGDYALMCKQGTRLVITPLASLSLLEVLRTLQPIEEDFAPISDPAPEPDM
jgi:antitoxin VapB